MNQERRGFTILKSNIYFWFTPLLLSILAPQNLAKSQQSVFPSPTLLTVQEPTDLLTIPLPILSETISAVEQLEWQVKTQQEGDYYKYYLESVSYQAQGHILWQFLLPDRIANRALWLTKESVDIRNYYGFPFLIGTIITNEAVFIADSSGLLALDKQTGKLLVDKPAESSPDSFFVDWGGASIITPSQSCETFMQLWVIQRT